MTDETPSPAYKRAAKTSEEKGRPIGRPSIKTPELVQAMMVRLMEGETLRAICREPDMPSRETVYRWLFEDRDFSDQYTKAREVGAEAVFEQTLEIADNDDYEAVQRDRLRVDTRKWFLAKMMPRKYADKVQVDNTHSGPDGKPIESQHTERVYRYVVTKPEGANILEDGSDDTSPD